VSFSDRTVALVVEGIGSDDSCEHGLALTFGRAAASTDYEWVEDALVAIPNAITTAVDVWTGRVRTSPINVSLANVDMVATRFLYHQARTDITLTADLAQTSSGGTVSLSSAALSAPCVVFVGNEALRITSNDGGGDYTCSRAWWGTSPEYHGTGAYVYERNPYLMYRTYQLIIFNHDLGTEKTIQRGYIEGIETSNKGATVEVRCQELLSLISRAQLNRGAPKIQVTGSIAHNEGVGGQLNASVSMDSRVWRDDSTAQSSWLNVGDTIVVGSQENGVFTPLATGAVAGGGAPDIDFDEVDGASVSPFSGDAYELFVVVGSPFGGALSLTSSAGLGDPEAFNAVSLAYSFLRSGRNDTDTGVDQWRGEWGMGLPEEYFDHAAIVALISESADDIVQRLILGWDGEAVDVEDLVCNRLLRPRGKFLTTTQSGLISIGAVTMLDIEQFALAPVLSPVPDRLHWEVDLNGAFSAMAAEVGETPWSDPDRVVVESRTAQAQDASRRSMYDTRRELVYDYSTLYAGGDALGVQAVLLSRLMSGIQAVPKISIDVAESSTTDYDLGGWYKISAPNIQQAWWVDADGERVAFPSTPDAQFTGILVGRKYDIKSGLYTLTLLMMHHRDNRFIRWRAPAAKIKGASGTTVTLEASEYHSDVADASMFSVGDYVQLYYTDGVATPGGDSAQITNISGNVITLDATFADTPTASMVLRLSHFNIYGDGGEPVAGAGRAYVFYADETTGYIHGTEEADIYG